MSLSNLLLAHKPIHEALLELDALSKGSVFEQEAIWHYMKATFNDKDNTPTEQLTALCKSEVVSAFPNAGSQEIIAIMKARNERILNLTVQLKADSVTIIEDFVKGLVQKATETFTQKINDLFTAKNIDVFLDFKIGQLSPSIQKGILESIRKKE